MFLETLANLNNGNSVADLDARLKEVVRAVELTGKAGSLTLKIDIKPMRQGEGDTVVIADSIKTAVPQPGRKEHVFYIDDGSLTRENPSQRRMFEEDGR